MIEKEFLSITALGLVLALAALVLLGYRLWRRQWAQVPLAQLAPMTEIHAVLDRLPAEERRPMLLQGWLTEPQWRRLRARALTSRTQVPLQMATTQGTGTSAAP